MLPALPLKGVHGGGWRHHRASGHSSHTGRTTGRERLMDNDIIWLQPGPLSTEDGIWPEALLPPPPRPLLSWMGAGGGGDCVWYVSTSPTLSPSPLGRAQAWEAFVRSPRHAPIPSGWALAGGAFVRYPPTLVRTRVCFTTGRRSISPSLRRGCLQEKKNKFLF